MEQIIVWLRKIYGLIVMERGSFLNEGLFWRYDFSELNLWIKCTEYTDSKDVLYSKCGKCLNGIAGLRCTTSSVKKAELVFIDFPNRTAI